MFGAIGGVGAVTVAVLGLKGWLHGAGLAFLLTALLLGAALLLRFEVV